MRKFGKVIHISEPNKKIVSAQTFIQWQTITDQPEVSQQDAMEPLRISGVNEIFMSHHCSIWLRQNFLPSRKVWWPRETILPSYYVTRGERYIKWRNIVEQKNGKTKKMEIANSPVKRFVKTKFVF